jgi:CDP-diacylglycerol--glycerol-3-phosphate 3-phosphatidyltransferase
LKVASIYIAGGFVWARDHIARGLVRLGVTPNMVTLAGLGFSIAAGVCLGLGARYWTAAACCQIGAASGDMLDGAVARIGGRGSRFGGIFDSTCDRIADFALFTGLGYYFVGTWPASHGGEINLTFALLAIMGALNGTLISYIRARAKHEMAECDVGFWQRGERNAAMLIGTLAHNLPMILWELGVAAGLTALQRLLHARRILSGRAAEGPRQGLFGAMRTLLFFDRPRRTLAYDLYTGMFIALLIFARVPETDILRRLMVMISGG